MFISIDAIDSIKFQMGEIQPTQMNSVAMKGIARYSGHRGVRAGGGASQARGEVHATLHGQHLAQPFHEG